MTKYFRGAAAIAAVMTATVAFASVTFDSNSGTGFVGKGDVQIAFGWNNAQLQSNAAGVTFTYDATDRYDVECEWQTETGNGKIIYHDITVPKHTVINAAVTYDARTRNQITGFSLNGFGTVIREGTAPVLGGACPGGNPGTITNVTLVSSIGGLFVVYGGNSVKIQ